MRNFVLLSVGMVGACTTEGVVIQGDLSITSSSMPPTALSIAVVYSPEDADHEAVSTTLSGPFPVGFTFEVPGPSWAALEEKDGFEIASGSIWIAGPGVTGSRDDGFSRELIQMGGYELLYLTDDPGSSTPFGVADLEEGWNLLQSMPVTCADRVPLGGGAFGWPAKYERRPIDTFLSITLGSEPWNPPFACP